MRCVVQSQVIPIFLMHFLCYDYYMQYGYVCQHKQSVAEWSKASSEKLPSIHEVCGSIPGDSYTYIFDALSLLRLLQVVCSIYQELDSHVFYVGKNVRDISGKIIDFYTFFSKFFFEIRRFADHPKYFRKLFFPQNGSNMFSFHSI